MRLSVNEKNGGMNVKTNRKIAAIGVLSLILTVIAALTQVTELPEARVIEVGETMPLAASGNTLEQTVNKYVLKNVAGFVGIYAIENMERPKTVTNIVVDKLRAADAELLGKGIEVAGEDELARLLEDLGS